MDIKELEYLQKQLELCKVKKAELEGQRKELNYQKDILKKEFEEAGVTIDTLPLTIAQTEKDLSEHKNLLNTLISEASQL